MGTTTTPTATPLCTKYVLYGERKRVESCGNGDDMRSGKNLKFFSVKNIFGSTHV